MRYPFYYEFIMLLKKFKFNLSSKVNKIVFKFFVDTLISLTHY